jgi:hypothetical protein
MRKELVKNEYYETFVDTEKNRLYSIYRGFWRSKSDFPNYIENTKRAMSFLTPGFTSLVDLREMKIPPPEIAELMVEAQKISAEAGFSRGARIVDGAIVKIATGRVSRESEAEEKVRTFDNWEEAEAWLDGAD